MDKQTLDDKWEAANRHVDRLRRDRDALLHALQVVWAGVPDHIRECLDEGFSPDSVIAIPQLRKGVRLVRDTLATAERD